MWIVDNKLGDLTSTTYVLKDLTSGDGWYFPEEIAELRGAYPPAWGDRLTEASQSALVEAVFPGVDLEFVDVRELVVDEEAFGHLGCHPYLNGRAMIRLQRPMAIGDRYFLEVNVDQGCEGLALLLRIEATGSEFEVVLVIRDGHWTV